MIPSDSMSDDGFVNGHRKFAYLSYPLDESSCRLQERLAADESSPFEWTDGGSSRIGASSPWKVSLSNQEATVRELHAKALIEKLDRIAECCYGSPRDEKVSSREDG